MNESTQKPLAGTAQDEAFTPLPKHYVDVGTSLVERPWRSLKHGEAFTVCDSFGDIGAFGKGSEGLYYRDTRYLSKFEIRFEGRRPLLLSSLIQDDNAAFSVDLANPDIHDGDVITLPRDTILFDRTKFLWQGTCFERVALRNFGERSYRFRIDVFFDADFHDLFEVRGAVRKRRGKCMLVRGDAGPEFHYYGLDGVTRRTALSFSPKPEQIGTHHVTYDIRLEPQECKSFFVTVACLEGSAENRHQHFFAAYRACRHDLRRATRKIATVQSSNDIFNEVCRRSTSDLYMLLSRKEQGLYPYAGIPWYSTAFGRDGIITAMQMLWTDPAIARGVLRFLAATQATDFDSAADAQPGKILHETRAGEMAHLGEVPFRLYYGTVDATPLFVMLAGMYFEQTGDLETISGIWPNIKAGLVWIDEFGDADGDGFVEYARESDKGLANQGWKDSYDSIFHANGRFPEAPIALCEVQAYVFAAKKYAADLAARLGEYALAEKLRAQAEALRVKFEAAFWCEEIDTYALALDADKNPCRVRTSNAGHALFAGIAAPERAQRVAETLLSHRFFSGWGVRTVATDEARYNPISYHNGSIWPHDNALLAMGFARYNLRATAARVFEAIFDAAAQQELRRLPELFCGFLRKPLRGPTAYPVACAPQAWAAATPFAFLAACLGLEIRHAENTICFTNPYMPRFLNTVTLRGLRLGSATIDIRLHGIAGDVAFNILRRDGDVKVALVK
jgi:glycogen debranching enzyme